MDDLSRYKSCQLWAKILATPPIGRILFWEEPETDDFFFGTIQMIRFDDDDLIIDLKDVCGPTGTPSVFSIAVKRDEVSDLRIEKNKFIRFSISEVGDCWILPEGEFVSKQKTSFRRGRQQALPDILKLSWEKFLAMDFLGATLEEDVIRSHKRRGCIRGVWGNDPKRDKKVIFHLEKVECFDELSNTFALAHKGRGTVEIVLQEATNPHWYPDGTIVIVLRLGEAAVTIFPKATPGTLDSAG